MPFDAPVGRLLELVYGPLTVLVPHDADVKSRVLQGAQVDVADASPACGGILFELPGMELYVTVVEGLDKFEQCLAFRLELLHFRTDEHIQRCEHGSVIVTELCAPGAHVQERQRRAKTRSLAVNQEPITRDQRRTVDPSDQPRNRYQKLAHRRL